MRHSRKRRQGWHFLTRDCTLRYADGRKIIPGVKYTMKNPVMDPVLCTRGMHACSDPIHTLTYAPGPMICRVVVEESIVSGRDKFVGRHRTVEWMGNATMALYEFRRFLIIRLSSWVKKHKKINTDLRNAMARLVKGRKFTYRSGACDLLVERELNSFFEQILVSKEDSDKDAEDSLVHSIRHLICRYLGVVREMRIKGGISEERKILSAELTKLFETRVKRQVAKKRVA